MSLFFIGILSSSALGQVPGIVDSLRLVLKDGSAGRNKVECLNELAWQLRFTDSEEAKTFANEAVKISKSIEFPLGEASAYMRLGVLEMDQRIFDEAKTYFDKALLIRLSEGKVEDAASTFNNIGLLYKLQSKYQKAIEQYQLGLKNIEKTSNHRLQAILYNNIGSCYRKLGDMEEAIKYIGKSIRLRERAGDEKGMGYSYLEQGSFHHATKNYKAAIDSYTSGLSVFKRIGQQNGIAKCHLNIGVCFYETQQYEDAINYFEKALQLDQYLDKDDVGLALKNVGAAQVKLSQFDIAQQFYTRSLSNYLESKNWPEVSAVYYNLGRLRIEQKMPKIALEAFLKAESTIDSIPSPFLKAQIYGELATLHELLGQTKDALWYSNQYSDLKDSLSNSFLSAVNYKLNYEKEVGKVVLLEERQHSVNQRNTFVFVVLILLLLFVISASAAIIYNLNANRKKQMAEQDAMDAHRKIDELIREQELKTNYARLEGQDEERKRVAADLHDRLGSMLSTIKLYFSYLDNKLDTLKNDSFVKYEKATELLDDACEEVRKIAHNMQSGLLTKYGLQAELEDLVETINQSNQLEVELFSHGLNERLELIIEAKIYRIIQELVSNVLKHAQASKLNIQINRFQGVLNIIVEDNGIGFQTGEVLKEEKGMGIKNIRSRVHDLEGTLHIDSGRGKGTTVSIDIPES